MTLRALETRCLIAYCTVLLLVWKAPAAETVVVDFEGLSSSPSFVLTDQIPGIVFDDVTVLTPATISSSPGIELSAATSGKSAAFTFGTLIHFNRPVTRVQMSVSPSFITVPLAMVSYDSSAYLVAYRQDGTVLTRSQTQIIEAVARQEDVTNFTPGTISVSSATPISYVSIDLDDPFSPAGASFFFDDLMLTIGQQLPPTRPTIRAEPWGNGQVLLSWGFFNSELQWTTNIAAGQWETIATTNTQAYFIDATKAKSMFFRVNRLLPP
jgi:hypothetical protein